MVWLVINRNEENRKDDELSRRFLGQIKRRDV